MPKSWKLCLLLAMLGSSFASQATPPSSALAQLHRGDFVRVNLLGGPVYHLQLNGLDESSLVGRSGIMSVHLRRREIASIEHETAPLASLPGLSHPPTTVWSLLSLTAVSFGAGPSCSGTSSAC